MSYSINFSYRTPAGLLVRIRQLGPEDTVHLMDIFEHMGADSRYSRFRTPINLTPAQIWEEARAISSANPEREVGYIAFTDLPGQINVPVAAARYVLLTDNIAEAAVSVRDDMQGKGIGTQLMLCLSEDARDKGIRTLVANVQNSNQAIFRLLNNLPYPFVRVPNGPESEIELTLEVDGPFS